MAIHDANLLRRFRVECLDKAERNIKEFTRKNQTVLTERITDTVDHLKVKHAESILESSYKLYSAAASFGRQDISNLADLLNRMMRNPALATSDEVIEAFEDALIRISAFTRPHVAEEKQILDGIYKVLRKYTP